MLKLFVVHDGDVYGFMTYYVIANSEDEAMSLVDATEKYFNPNGFSTFTKALDVKLADNEMPRIIKKHEDLY